MADKAQTKLVLKPGVIHGFLDNFSTTADRECLQFTDINCTGQELEQLGKAMDEVKDVQNVDFSSNGLADVAPIKDLTKLITLNLSNNRIKNVAVFAMEDCFMSLKWLDISNNKFTEFPAFKCPKLEYLNINGNKLEKVNEAWTGHENLKVVSAVDNKFKSLVPFKSMPKLEELYMAQNMLVSLSGWEALPALKKLHLRRNKIAKVDEEGLAELPELRYLNLRHNAIEGLDVVYRLF
jgi:Leucine-rich repeat (LRR) protein